MTEITKGQFSPESECKTDDDWTQYPREYAVPSYHPVGSCKMGIDDEAVVDNELRVRGVTNLRVIDASIMPNVTSGNTNAPSMMIAERASGYCCVPRRASPEHTTHTTRRGQSRNRPLSAVGMFIFVMAICRQNSQ